MRIFFCIIICSFVFGSCAQREQIKPYGTPVGVTINAKTPIDYHLVRFYSLTYCSRCHHERTGPDLSTYEGVVSNVDRVMETILEGEMPPLDEGFAPLSSCQIEVLQKWIQRGMPEKEGVPISGTSSCF